jgi:hypothetical protein
VLLLEFREAKQEAKQKAITIQCLLKDVSGYLMYYEPDGTLNFGFRACALMKCKITPNNDDTYLMIIYQTHNMYQSTELSVIDNIKADELNFTFNNTIKDLNEIYKKEKRNSWWGYKRLI